MSANRDRGSGATPETNSIQGRFIGAYRTGVRCPRGPRETTGSALATVPPLAPEPNDMDAALMLLKLHERGIHVFCAGIAGTARRVSVVTTERQGRAGTKSCGQNRRRPAQDRTSHAAFGPDDDAIPRGLRGIRRGDR